MTLKPNNKTEASAVGDRLPRFPFLGMLLISFGLLLSIPQRGQATPGRHAPGHPPAGGVSISILHDNSVAGSGVADVVQITLNPAPVPGDLLEFTISTSSYTPQITTDASGKAVLNFASSIIGPATVEIYDVTTGADLGTVVVNFVAAAGPPDPTKSYFVVTQNPAAADGSAQDVVKAFIFDANGNPVGGYNVAWSIMSGVANFVGSPSTVTITPPAFGGGTASEAFNSTTAGTVNVQAFVSGPGGSFQLTDISGNNFLPIQFTIPPPSPAKSYIVAVTTPMPADGTSQDVVKAVVLNALGNPVPDGTVVTFQVQTGTATLTTTGVTSGGVVIADLTSLNVEFDRVTASVVVGGVPVFLTDQANPGNGFVTVQFVNPPPSVSNSYVVAVVTPMPADGTSQDVVKAVVLNTLGAPVPDGTVVTFNIQVGTATITTTGVTSGGVAIADLTSLNVESDQVTASVLIGGVPTLLPDQANPGNKYVTVQFTQPPINLTTSYVVAVTTPMPADGTSQDVVKAVVYNTAGNPVPDGTVVTFTVQSGTATITTTGVTSGGVAIADLTSLNVEIDQVTASVVVGGVPTLLHDQANPANTYVSVQFTQPPVNLTTSYVVAVTTPMPADGTSQDVVKAVVYNTAGNPVPDGTVVTFTVQSGTATLTTTGVTSGGVAIADLTSLNVEIDQVTASVVVGGVPTLLTDQANPANTYVTVQFTQPPVNLTTSYVVAVVTPMPADGTSQDVVKAVVYNTAGNPVPDGTVVTFTVQSGTATLTTTGVTSGGVAIADLTSLNVEIDQVTASVVVGGVPTLLTDQANPGNTYVTVQFTALPINTTTSYVLAVVTPMPADGTSQDVVKAVVYNTAGNPVPDGTVVTFTVTSGTATITTTGVTSGGVAIADLTSLNVEIDQVTASVLVGGVPTLLHDQANPANTYVTVQFTTPPVNLTPSYVVAVVTPMPADGTSQDVVKAVVYNTAGNPVPDGTVVTFTVTSGTATITTTGVTSGGVAIADLTSLNVEIDQVTASVVVGGVPTLLTDQANPANTYVTVQFTTPPVNLTTSYVVAVTTPMLADGTSQDVVEAVVYNTTGVPVPDGTVVTFKVQVGTATLTTTGVTSGGVAIADLTSLNVEIDQVTASVVVGGVPTLLHDQANPANTYVTVQFTDLPADASKSYIVAVVTPMPADGTSQDEVKAVVYNTAGNPVPDGTVVTFKVQSGTATITTTGVTSGGVAIAYLTSVNVELDQVTAQIQIGGVPTFLTDQANAANQYVTVQFVVGPADPTKSYIIVTQDNAAADGTSQDIVTAYLFDAEGRPVITPTDIKFTVKSGTATNVSGANQTITSSGQSVYASNVVGAAQVQAQVQIGGVWTYLDDQNNTSNNYVTIHFVTGPPVTGDPGNPGSGGGNPPGGGGTPPGGGGGTGPGGGGGTGPGGNNNFTILFIPQPYDYRLADGTQQDSLIAYISDAGGHAISNLPVTFFIQTTPAAGTISSGVQFVGSPVNVMTDGSGMARIALTSTTPGTVFVDATIKDPITGNDVLIEGSYQILHFEDVPDVTNVLTQLDVIVKEALADGSQQTEVKAHIVDMQGNVMPDQEVTFSIDSGTGTIVTPQPVTTDANGDAYIYIISKTPGDVLITATVDGQKIVYGSPARVTFAPINIYVPKVFTPNSDGMNDVLKPILVGISTFHYFTVYNRWGNIVYTTQDPNQGWDGYWKGVAQPVETYLWIAEGIDENGRKIVAHGMTSLVR